MAGEVGDCRQQPCAEYGDPIWNFKARGADAAGFEDQAVKLVEGHSGAEMIAYVEGAIAQGHWGVICMHGVGGDHLAIATDALRELCAYLDQNRNRIWTDTFIHIADYVDERRASSP